MSNEILIKYENVSKKFCKDLKKSLIYGIHDIAGEMLGYYGRNAKLRKEEFWALKDISFELKRGECLGLIGKNGAGKSTILKLINGLIKPDKGKITVRGRVGALIELGAGFNPILTGRENVYINGAVLGLSKKDIDKKFDGIVDFAELEEFIDMPVQSYSSGMKVRLGFAIAVQMEPDVLIIDEVLAVGDQSFKIKCFRKISSLLQSNISIILVSHSMIDIERVCNNSILLEHGSIVSKGQTPTVIKDYLTNVHSKEQDGLSNIQRSNNPVIFNHGTLQYFNSQLIFETEFTSSIESHQANLVAILWKQHSKVCYIASGHPGLSIAAGKHKIRFTIDDVNLTHGHYHVSIRLRELHDPLQTYGICGRIAELYVDDDSIEQNNGLNLDEGGVIAINNNKLTINVLPQ